MQVFKQEHPSNEQENVQKLCRFWQMFIRNHETFQQYSQFFNNHIINSMQQIGCHNVPNQMYRKIALDIAFLSIEWKAK